MSNHLLELSNINVIFEKSGGFLKGDRKFHVLKDVNFHIDKGEIVALVGESGCGKTTLGKIITGLIKPTSGDVFYKGEKVNKLLKNNEYRNAVQFIQQDSYAALNPVKTIYASLKTAIKLTNPRSNRIECVDLASKYLEDVGLTPAEQFLYKYPHQMSGGQRQRVLMARALALDPQIIVADEPVSMIDVSLRISILNLMTKLNKEKNISFVYITHDLSTARFIANNGRIAVMYLGEIVELNSVKDLVSYPLHPYTKALVAAVPIPDPKISRKQNDIPILNMNLMSLENRTNCCPFYQRCPHASEKCQSNEIEYQTINNASVKCNLNINEKGEIL